MLEDILVFLGLMTTLGVVAKIVLAAMQRRRGNPQIEQRTLEEIAAPAALSSASARSSP